MPDKLSGGQTRAKTRFTAKKRHMISTVPSTKREKLPQLAKCPSGIRGLDEIMNGGFPRGRVALVCGGPGSGKTLLGLEFLARGATDFNEPGVCVSFEETAKDLIQNVASLGFDFPSLIRRKKLVIDHVRIEKSEIDETGEYDLEGLFVRIGYAIRAIGAKRVLLDTIETLFSGLTNEGILRAELRRLFGWLKTQGVTAMVTGERGASTLTRHGLEEYISDCVIVLDHRTSEAIATRRLRIAKYRGTTHGTNEFPFLIGPTGISVMPISSLSLDHPAPSERVSTGVPDLDQMLDGKGYYRGSTVLISGTAGTGKTSFASCFVAAAAERGERSLLYAFEESVDQVIRNMRSIGIDLESARRKGLLHYQAARATHFGLELHLLTMLRDVEEFKPRIVVLDPISTLISSGSQYEVKVMLLRLIDILKQRQITTILTCLTTGGGFLEATEVNVSSFVDTWILLRDLESNGERNRLLHVLKSRGMPHSNQVREMMISNEGLHLHPVYLGSDGMVIGSARVAQEATNRAHLTELQQDAQRLESALARQREVASTRIRAINAELASEEAQIQKSIQKVRDSEHRWEENRREMSESRHTDSGKLTPARKTARRSLKNGR